MHTKRYILTAIALLLVTILCAGLAYADEPAKPKYTFTYEDQIVTDINGKEINKIYYFHTPTDPKKAVTLGEVMEFTVTGLETTSNEGKIVWMGSNDDVVKVDQDKSNSSKLVLVVKGPGSATITWGVKDGDKDASLATVKVNLNIVNANLIYTANRTENYKFAPGSSYDFKKDYEVVNASDRTKDSSYNFDDVTWSVYDVDKDGKVTVSKNAEFTSAGVLKVNLNADVNAIMRVTATLHKKAAKDYAGKDIEDEDVSPVIYRVQNKEAVPTEYFVEVAGISLTLSDDVEEYSPVTDQIKDPTKTSFKKDFIYSEDMNREFTVTGSSDYVDSKKNKVTGYKWSSSDETIATVTQSTAKAGDEKTTVTIKGPGKVTITATAIVNNAEVDVTNSFTLELTELKAKEITFNAKGTYPRDHVEVGAGDSIVMTALEPDVNGNTLYYALVPETTGKCSYTIDNLIWTTDAAPTIATIDVNTGKLTANKDALKGALAGEVIINVTAKLQMKNTSISKTIPVTIVEPKPTNPAILLQFKVDEFTFTEGQKDQDVKTNNLVETPTDHNSTLLWKSDNEGVATVVAGKVTAVKAGTANITVYTKDNENVQASVKVTVTAAPVAEPITAVEFVDKSWKLWKGKEVTLTRSILKFTPAYYIEPANISFSSSNPDVIYVKNDEEGKKTGKLTAVKTGTADLVVSVRLSNDKILEAKMPVTVEEFNITGLSFGENAYKMTLYASEEEGINDLDLSKRLIIKPDDWNDVVTELQLEDNLVVWSSNKSRIATVDQSGVVTAHAPGEVTIYAVSAKDKNIGAQVTVTVTGREASKIKLNKDEIVLEEGQALSEVFTMTVQPANAHIENISYKFSKTGIATVEDMFEDDDKSDETKFVKYAGKPVNFLVAAKGQAGETWLTITANDGVKDLTAKIKITVKTAKKNLAFKQKAYTMPIFLKKSLNKVTLEVLDKDTGKEYKGALAWSSSDKDVATVNKNGTITLKAEGTTEITATTKDGNKTAVKTKLTVKKWAISKLTGTNKQLMTVGQKVNIKDWVTVKPVGKVYNDKLTLKSSAKDVVMVDSLGNISALKAGEATITVTAKDDTTKTKTITVTVVEKKVKK